MRLIRTNARYAGCAPPGEAGWVEDGLAEQLLASGAAVDCGSLSARLGVIRSGDGPEDSRPN